MNVDEIDKSIINMLSNGYSRPTIASVLGFSVAKTDYRIQELMSEFESKNAAQLVAYALRNKVIE